VIELLSVTIADYQTLMLPVLRLAAPGETHDCIGKAIRLLNLDHILPGLAWRR